MPDQRKNVEEVCIPILTISKPSTTSLAMKWATRFSGIFPTWRGQASGNPISLRDTAETSLSCFSQTPRLKPRNRRLEGFRASSAPGQKRTDCRPASVSALLRYPKAKIILMISCARRMPRYMRQNQRKA